MRSDPSRRSRSSRRAVALVVATLGAGLGPSPSLAGEAGTLVPLDVDGLASAWLVPNDGARTTVTLVVLAGESDNADRALGGLAHYAEHLVWESAVVDEEIEARADTNASTTQDLTDYWLSGPPERLGAMLGTLAGALEPIALPEPFMASEVDVIQREYRYRDGAALWPTLRREIARHQHGALGPGRGVIGTPESIRRLTPDAARDWAARTHVPANTALIVHGPHAADEVEPLVAEVFADIVGGRTDDAPNEAPAPFVYTPEPPGRERAERRDARAGGEELWLSIVGALPSGTDVRTLPIALDLLAGVLDSTLPGSLQGPLRYDDFVARELELELSVVAPTHVELYAIARPDRGVALDTLLARLEGALGDVAADGLPAPSVERARRRLLDELDATERPDRFVVGALYRALALDTEPLSFADWRETLATLPLASVESVLDALVREPRRFALLLRPEEGSE